MTATHSPEPSNPRPEQLSDQELLNEFGELVRRERHHVASLLRHVDIIDRRKLWARQGYSSLFDFLVKRYHMSESTAVKRIGAARTARKFPILFTMVARGEIHLSGIHCIQAHITPENYERVLADAKHKTMRQLEELVARLAPKPDVPTTLRKLPERHSSQPKPSVSAQAVPALAAEASRPTAPAQLLPRRDPHPTPLASGRYKLQVTINQSTRDKLDQLQDLLAHQLPKGDVAAIVERAFDALFIQIHKRKTGITAKPRAPRAPTSASQTPAPESASPGKRTRHLKAAVRRRVWPRDDARCGFFGEDGHRCNATRGLQFAHRQPWAKGGPDTEDNIDLRCPAHNALEADRDYGSSFMANKRKQHSKPLKVREPRARYVLRDTMRSAVGESPWIDAGTLDRSWVASHGAASRSHRSHSSSGKIGGRRVHEATAFDPAGASASEAGARLPGHGPRSRTPVTVTRHGTRSRKPVTLAGHVSRSR